MALKLTAPTDAAMSALQTENITRGNAANSKPRDNIAGMDSAICHKEASRPRSCFLAYKKNRKNIEVFFYFDEMFVSACCHSQRERRQKGGDKNVHATSTSILQKRSFCWFWIHLCQHRLTGDLYLCVRGLCASETKHMYVCDGACGFLFSFPLPCFGLISSCLHFSLLLRLPAPPWLPLEVHSDSL